MIENYANLQTAQTAQTQRVLTYVKNERTGGSVPKYQTVKASDANIAQNIETSLYDVKDEAALAYQPTRAIAQGKDQFGFADLLDMVNPLHHIPVVGHFYREFTGDQIKPISRVIGGAAFGGPLGTAGALVDTVITSETGKDATGNAMAFAFQSNKTNAAQNIEAHVSKERPKESSSKSIEDAINLANDSNMARTLLSFSNLATKDEAALKYEAYERADNKMNQPLEREPITQISFSQKGGLYSL